MSDGLIQAIGERLRTAQHIVIVSHIRPDGDAIGSVLGLGLALEKVGKSVQMVLPDGISSTFRHLPGAQQVVKKVIPPFDLVVAVDCADMARIGGALDGLERADIVIDHHITNPGFGSINLVDPEAVATSAILVEQLPQWGLSIDTEIASDLLSGLISDTLGFRTSNMTPKALRLAADLMEKGAALPELYQHALMSHTYEAIRYWGQGLSKLQREDRLIWCTLTLVDRGIVEYYNNDDADLINFLSSTDEIEIALIFVEQKGNRVKVSWRSQPGIDVSKLAIQFGGGGHPAAAGADVTGTLEDVQKQVLDSTRLILNKNGYENNLR